MLRRPLIILALLQRRIRNNVRRTIFQARGWFDNEGVVDKRWNTSDQTSKDAAIDTLKKLQSNLTESKDGNLSDTKLREFLQKIESSKVSDENSSKKSMRENLGVNTSVEASRLHTTTEFRGYTVLQTDFLW